MREDVKDGMRAIVPWGHVRVRPVSSREIAVGRTSFTVVLVFKAQAGDHIPIQ
jgi:hypothetical protein